MSKSDVNGNFSWVPVLVNVMLLISLVICASANETPETVLRSQSSMLAFALLLLLLPTGTTGSKPDSTTWHQGACLPREREALLSIKAGITFDPLSLLSSWQGQDCCRWMGVRCSNRTGHVVKLDLHGENLGGEISSSLKALEHLQHLDLSGNFDLLVGPRGRIPDFLGSLHGLRYLNLSGLNCSGPVPPQLGNLSRLQYLDLGSDFELYSADISWLRQLSLLKHLDMSYVNLTTVTGWEDTVNTLSSLEVIILCECQLSCDNNTTHSAPRTNLTRLKILDLSVNSLETFDAIRFLLSSTSLKYLNLEYSQLTGLLPAQLGNLSSLEVLQLNGNNVKGMIRGTLMNLCSLKVFDLSTNSFQGNVMEFLKRSPNCSSSKLQVLNLGGNNITGSLPAWINRMTSLSTLDLDFNRLTGTLTTGIGTLSKLTYLDLSYNQMNGHITEEHFYKLSDLQILDLSANSFTMEWSSNWVPPFRLHSLGLHSCCVGPRFPNWLKWQRNISTLFMSNASIADTMPDWFWNVFSKASILHLSSNNISGTLPAALAQMEAVFLDLSSNQFTGSVQQVPPNIVTLDISRNILTGPLPLNIRPPMQIQSLILFDNFFTGTISTSICQMKSLSLFDIGNNMITGQLPRCSEYMASRSNMIPPSTASLITDSSSGTAAPMSLEILRLDNNNLSDEFPLLFQNCPELNFIDLGKNKFFRSIPAWIGEKLVKLGILRLRSNTFSGSIPIQIRELHHLQFLDLAHNNFTGTIPQFLLKMDGGTIEAAYLYPPSTYGALDEAAEDQWHSPYVSIPEVADARVS